ncbi:carboxylating nicotinate-nucleotide diphosphorylase [Catenovulum adriaticum]|uniref:nicotinate-nucleotide diphosphorylase (carboxylating) n=1 Tax=Catenovulum adriaticum TaxID=2984846 RepID=A0ABY7ALY4_9ALTE|nr:carboxylating nicotinate-nucleotide diphosphorylase [Catenovulum sp. TS8]WAJ69475.1 carboxylating nicotinate-nucleotide diphosphorylase [Catenovulum sp. TS8]
MTITLSPELKNSITKQIELALFEDLNGLDANNDITAQLIPVEQSVSAHIITREDCTFCGQAWLIETFKQLGDQIDIQWAVKDGDKLAVNQLICTLTGSARTILTGERTALNFIQTLSATATATALYVDKIKHTHTKLLDTRKTIPGMRLAQKYAVTCGGGVNHRVGLYDAFLIKENHITAAGGIDKAVTQARKIAPGKAVEVEVENNAELQLALDAGADIIMLDNYSPVQIAEAAAINNASNKPAKLEMSGNITINTIADYAQAGVDFISSGALTKHIQAIDLSLRIK